MRESAQWGSPGNVISKKEKSSLEASRKFTDNKYIPNLDLDPKN